MSSLMEWEGSGTSEQGWRKGPWTSEEDKLLRDYINLHGDGRWSSVSKYSGLNRSGKSCRLRWVNYLRPGLKKENLTPQEEGIIILYFFPKSHFKIKAKQYQRQAKRKAEAIGLRNHDQAQQTAENDHQMKKDTRVITYDDDDHGEVNTTEKGGITSPPQSNQDMGFAHPSITNHHQYSSHMVDYYINEEIASCSDTITLDDLWGSFWNQDDLHNGIHS